MFWKRCVYELFTPRLILARQHMPATQEATIMNSKMVCAALSLVLAVSGASIAVAGGKKAQVDPRAAYISSSAKTERPNGRQNNCDVNPECNGWAAALRLSNAGKLKF
jgi:hypothetical protein